MSSCKKINCFSVLRNILQQEKRIFWVIFICLIIGILLRIFFVFNFPFSNDEGAYLYDAKTLISSRIPAGDVLTKAPSIILCFMVGEFLTNNSLFAARFVNLVLGIVITIPLYIVSESIRKKSGLVAVIIWLVSSGPITILTLGHTETGAIFFALSCLALFISAGGTSGRKVFTYAFLSGIAFVLALGARKTNLSLIVPIGIIAFSYVKDIRKRNSIISLFIAGAIFVFIIWFGLVAFLYGKIGLTEASGGGYLEIVVQKLTGNGSVDVWGIKLMDSLKTLSRISTVHSIFALLSFPVVLYMLFGKSKKNWRGILLIPFLWMGTLGIFYVVWPTFLVDYAADFFAPLTIIFSVLVVLLTKQRDKRIVCVAIFAFVFINIASLVSSHKHPWTGMFNSESVKSMAGEINRSVSPGEDILTAAVIVLYVSNHKVFKDISHPLWYGYDFIVIGKKDAFLPKWEDVAAEIKNGQTKWLLMEHLTDYAYLRGKDNLINELNNNWELVSTVPNNTSFRSNTLKLYKRKVSQ